MGAAQTVTGSKHLLRTRQATVLLDCGLFQGRRHEAREKNRTLDLDASAVDAVVLSHAHIDHSGALPVLVKRGFSGPIYATPATRDLCAVMLVDAALIQEADARYINKVIDRDGADMDRVEPLYTESDTIPVLAQMLSLPYRRRQLVAPGVHVTFLDAGHVLGSAITVLDVEEDGETKPPSRGRCAQRVQCSRRSARPHRVCGSSPRSRSASKDDSRARRACRAGRARGRARTETLSWSPFSVDRPHAGAVTRWARIPGLGPVERRTEPPACTP